MNMLLVKTELVNDIKVFTVFDIIKGNLYEAQQCNEGFSVVVIRSSSGKITREPADLEEKESSELLSIITGKENISAVNKTVNIVYVPVTAKPRHSGSGVLA